MNNEYIFSHFTIIILSAAVSGIILARLKQPIMVGYILAGIMFGPHGFGFISGRENIEFFSDLGIILLLFVIGMELNVRSFIKMWKIPTFFTVIQVCTNLLIAIVISKSFELPLYLSILAAFVVSLSSTAAIVKVLEHLGELRTDVGHISMGILIAQDLAIVPMMLIMKNGASPIGGGQSLFFNMTIAVLTIVFLLRYINSKEKIELKTHYLITNPDLTPVVALGFCFAVSSLVVFFGLSEAYGAFLAGLFLGNTQDRQQVLNSVKPIQNVLLMFFFLSVGLMFNIEYLFDNFFMVFAILLLVTIWKIISNTVLLKTFSIELAKATTIGIILSQLGEFALVLANVAYDSQIIGVEGQNLIVCVTALSLSLSSIFIAFANRTRNLSFVGDNSISSILRVILSRSFSKEVNLLTAESEKLKNA